MYSILPAIVAILFLVYGVYVLHDQGVNHVSVSLFILCATSFCWQFTWSILFQVNDADTALLLIKFGYLMVLFLPTGIYHFLTEICERTDERRWVYLSYGFSVVLAIVLLSSDLFISGYYRYFFGYYPKAGPAHALHLLQTAIVIIRGLYLTYRTQQQAAAELRMRYRLYLYSLLIYFMAAVDYLCNYGFEFYPPGVIFIAVSLSVIIFNAVKHLIVNLKFITAVIAHEMRTPMTSIRLRVNAIDQFWPVLYEGYQLAVEHGLCEQKLGTIQQKVLSDLAGGITREIDRTHITLDTMLLSASLENHNRVTFANYTIKSCIDEALERYPFDDALRKKIHLAINENFSFHGSNTLLVLVLLNLLRNAVYALESSALGDITIRADQSGNLNYLSVSNTGSGISAKQRDKIFDSFYTTKPITDGTGLGLTFCRRVMTAFGGAIKCESADNQYTTFTLEFPKMHAD